MTTADDMVFQLGEQLPQFSKGANGIFKPLLFSQTSDRDQPDCAARIQGPFFKRKPLEVSSQFESLHFLGWAARRNQSLSNKFTRAGEEISTGEKGLVDSWSVLLNVQGDVVAVKHVDHRISQGIHVADGWRRNTGRSE